MATDRAPERRRDPLGPLRLMAEAEGYCMVRRPGCMPFVLSSQNFRYFPLMDKQDDR